jgi:hypothetical protein
MIMSLSLFFNSFNISNSEPILNENILQQIILFIYFIILTSIIDEKVWYIWFALHILTMGLLHKNEDYFTFESIYLSSLILWIGNWRLFSGMALCFVTNYIYSYFPYFIFTKIIVDKLVKLSIVSYILQLLNSKTGNWHQNLVIIFLINITIAASVREIVNFLESEKEYYTFYLESKIKKEVFISVIQELDFFDDQNVISTVTDFLNGTMYDENILKNLVDIRDENVLKYLVEKRKKSFIEMFMFYLWFQKTKKKELERFQCVSENFWIPEIIRA